MVCSPHIPVLQAVAGTSSLYGMQPQTTLFGPQYRMDTYFAAGTQQKQDQYRLADIEKPRSEYQSINNYGAMKIRFPEIESIRTTYDTSYSATIPFATSYQTSTYKAQQGDTLPETSSTIRQYTLPAVQTPESTETGRISIQPTYIRGTAQSSLMYHKPVQIQAGHTPGRWNESYGPLVYVSAHNVTAGSFQPAQRTDQRKKLAALVQKELMILGMKNQQVTVKPCVN